MLTRLIVLIILQFIQMLTHYVVKIETNIMLYVNYMLIKRKNKTKVLLNDYVEYFAAGKPFVITI